MAGLLSARLIGAVCPPGWPLSVCASGSKDWLPKALTGWAPLPKPVRDYSVNKTETSRSERWLSVLKVAGHVMGGILLLLEEDQLPGVLCVCVCVHVGDRDRQRQDAAHSRMQ